MTSFRLPAQRSPIQRRWDQGLLALPIMFALAACQAAGDRSVAADATSNTATETATQPESVISGTASYRERVKMPPGASLRVQLIDQQLVDTPQAVIAEAVMRDIGGPPIPFSLKYDPAKLRAGGQYGLHAALYGTEGELWFVTDTRVPVTPGDKAPVALNLVRVPASEESGSGASAAANVSHWQCGDLRVAAIGDASGSITLSMSGRKLALPAAVSASGSRHADAQGNEFWSKGRSGTLALAGQQKRDCIQTDQASPWHDATTRGIGFRAVGNEPGWFVEVGHGAAPMLRATLDYGERLIEVTNAVPLDGDAPGFRGKAGDGADVVLSIRRGTCADGMSGEVFEASATLKVGEKTYQGCGAFLAD